MTALVALYPLLLTQGLWAARQARRLPEAEGPRTGSVGSGPPLRLLLVGDSSVAGVGAPTQDHALAGGISRRLGKRYRVTYRIVAQSGATTVDTLENLAAVTPEPYDVAVVALGVNDTKNGLTLRTWRHSYAQLLDHLTDTFGVARIVVSGMPPVERFPILPHPLRDALGSRAALFDAALQGLADARPEVTYMAMDFPMCVTDMAPDGFHPGPAIYDAWAAALTDVIVNANPTVKPS